VRQANGVVRPGICSENVDLRAPAVDALEPADLRDHPHPAAADRKVVEPTPIAAVNPG
jgi:hypothetical protein